MATIHQFDNNPEEDEFYLVEIYWFITYTLVEPSINQQFKSLKNWQFYARHQNKFNSLNQFWCNQQKIILKPHFYT